MPSPLVSIGLPVYNGDESVERAIKSILAQDFQDFELIIADNASTDSTATICQDYAQKDKRIRYVRNEKNIGVGPNHNLTFHLSRGKYFQWSAHDVECLPGMIRKCVDVLENAPPTVVLAYPRCAFVDAQGNPAGMIQHPIASKNPSPRRRLITALRYLWLVSEFYGLSVSSALRKTRLFDSFPASDYVLIGEMAMLGEIWELSEVLLKRNMGTDHGAAAYYNDRKGWSEWIDPNTAHQTMLPIISYKHRVALEYIRSAWRLPLRPKDKLQCMVIGPIIPYYRDFLRITGPLRHKWRTRTEPSANHR